MKKAGKKPDPLAEAEAAELQTEMTQGQITGPGDPSKPDPGTDYKTIAEPETPPENGKKKAKKPEKPPEPAFPLSIEENIQVKHCFEESELAVLGQGLAAHQANKDNLTLQLKSVSGDYRNKIKMIEVEITGATERIQQGFEMRPAKAFVLHNREGAYKCFYHVETGEFIRKEAMTEVDFGLLSPPWPKGHLFDAPYKPKAPAKKSHKKKESA